MRLLLLLCILVYTSSIFGSDQYYLIHSKDLNIYSMPNEDSMLENLKAPKGSCFKILSDDGVWVKVSASNGEYYLHKPSSENFLVMTIKDESFLSNLSNTSYFNIRFKILLIYVIVAVSILICIFVIWKDDVNIWSIVLTGLLSILLLLFYVLYKNKYINYWLFDSWYIYDLISWDTIKTTFSLLWNSLVFAFIIFVSLTGFMVQTSYILMFNSFKKSYLQILEFFGALVIAFIIYSIALPLVVFICSIFTDVVMDTSSFRGFFSTLWSWLKIEEGWVSFILGILISFYIFYSIYVAILALCSVRKITFSIIVYFISAVILYTILPVMIYDTLECLSNSNVVLGLFGLFLIFAMMQGAKSSSHLSYSTDSNKGEDESIAVGVNGYYREDEMKEVDAYNNIYRSPNPFDTKRYKKIGDNKYKEVD